MKPFSLEPSMVTMGGVFYPTGYMFVVFPSRDDAAGAGDALRASGFAEPAMLLSPEDVLQHVVRTVGNADAPLPSAGTEADTVRKYADYASKGHWALMVHAPSAEDTERVMAVFRKYPFAYGQKYRHLVIEDLE
jgi:hypothetical protein